MDNLKETERNIRETAESIYKNYPPTCKMVIKFLSYKDRKAGGYIKSVFYENHQFYFEGLDHLLLLMEDIMDMADYPQIEVDYRNLEGRTLKKQNYILKNYNNRETISIFEDTETKEINLKKKLVSVQVISRRNCSIQGVLNINTEKKVFFRSGMELIRLLYEYLE